ncbi:MAG: hypothetical protein Q7S29_06255 [Candidatus Peribacter sp.]|nr:hypothetical protein [Candidatus Peribacter sp.]
MDKHTFQKTVESCESLPEAMRARARNIGEKLTDERRSELATNLSHANERIREKEVEAERSIAAGEQAIEEIEHGLRHADRDQEELQSHAQELSSLEQKMKRSKSSIPPHEKDAQ